MKQDLPDKQKEITEADNQTPKMDEVYAQSNETLEALGLEESQTKPTSKEKPDKQKAKSIIESLLFINERPIETKEFMQILDAEKREVEKFLDELIEEYSQRAGGVCIVKVAGGYQMCSVPDNESWVKKMYRERGKRKLSVASLETIAIIAYKQPITKIEIESIRGVNVDGVIKNLLDLGLIKMGGRKEVVGRPFLYITTRKFLEYFGLNALKDLPKLEEFAALAQTDKIVQEMTQNMEQQNINQESQEANQSQVQQDSGATEKENQD